MKFYLTYLQLELKRAYKSFPKMLLSSVFMLLIIAALAFCGEKLLYGNAGHEKAKIAFVTEDTSKLVSLATMLLQSSESISSICNFVDTDSQSAKEMLDEREVIASITIPDGFMDGLRHGTNVPLVICFSDDMTAVAGLLKELSHTAARILASTQAGIFAQHDFYYAHNLKEQLPDANYDLNEKYIKFIFSRNSLFQKNEVSATGNVSVKDYYTAGALTLFFMLFSMSFVSFLMEDTYEFKKKLFSRYMNVFQYFFSKALIVFSMFYTMYLLLSLVASALGSPALFALWYAMIPALLCLSAFIVLLYELAPNKLGGVIFIFTVSVMSAVLSGCILPVSYLPHSLAAIGSALPSTRIIRVLSGTLGHSPAAADFVYLALAFAFCFAASSMFEKKVRLSL